MLERVKESFRNAVVGTELGLRASGDAKLDLLNYLEILSG